MPADVLPLGRWETFYVIVGSSGGALTGLLFVVVALAAERARQYSSQGLGAFTSPSIFHFGIVLFIAAVVTMPRDGLASLGVMLGLSALTGGTVTVLAIRRIAQFEKYRPVAEDWIWHGLLPCAAYVALLLGAILLQSATKTALYIVASVTLALLFVGIHNAWDAALYSATSIPRDQDAAA
jgi:sulfite exporter TauE/SafE